MIPTIADCSGRIWFTDLQLQEGSALSGYAPHTEVCLQKCRENGGIKPPVPDEKFSGVIFAIVREKYATQTPPINTNR